MSRWRRSSCPAAPCWCSRPTPSTWRPSASAPPSGRSSAARRSPASRASSPTRGSSPRRPERGRPGRARQAGDAQEGAGRALMSGAWTLGEAEEHLLSLELFGMRFGLERMRRLLTALGSPQERFRAVHVVGTNGKSSTVRFTAALLEANGVKTGAYLSPHLTTFAERIRVGDRDLTGAEFGAAIQRAAARRREGRPDLSRRRARNPVRVADRRRIRRARPPRRRGGRDRGGPGRPLRRHQRAGRGGRRAHERRAGAHALARADDRRHRGGEARGRARRRHLGARRRAPRRARAGRADRRADRPARVSRH